MLAGQGRNDDIELFQGHDTIRFPGPGNMTYQVEKELNRRVVRQGKYFVNNIARPVLGQHLLFGNEDDVVAQRLAFAHKVAAFEKGCEADDIQWFWLRCHFSKVIADRKS